MATHVPPASWETLSGSLKCLGLGRGLCVRPGQGLLPPPLLQAWQEAPGFFIHKLGWRPLAASSLYQQSQARGLEGGEDSGVLMD